MTKLRVSQPYIILLILIILFLAVQSLQADICSRVRDVQRRDKALEEHFM